MSNPIDDWIELHTSGMKHAVEFGAGRFDYTRKIKSLKVTGVDVWPEYIQKYAPEFINAVAGDMRDWPRLGLGEFDCAVFVDSLEHITFEEGANLLMSLQDSGHVEKIIVFVPEGFHEQTEADCEGTWAAGNPHQAHKAVWVAADLMELGFQVDRRPYFHHEAPVNEQAAMFGVWVSD